MCTYLLILSILLTVDILIVLVLIVFFIIVAVDLVCNLKQFTLKFFNYLRLIRMGSG